MKLQISHTYLSKTSLEIMQTPAQLPTQQLCPSSSHALPPIIIVYYYLFPSLHGISPRATLLQQGISSAPIAGEEPGKGNMHPRLHQNAVKGTGNSTRLCRS